VRGGDAFFVPLFARASRLRARPVGLQSSSQGCRPAEELVGAALGRAEMRLGSRSIAAIRDLARTPKGSVLPLPQTKSSKT